MILQWLLYIAIIDLCFTVSGNQYKYAFPTLQKLPIRRFFGFSSAKDKKNCLTRTSLLEVLLLDIFYTNILYKPGTFIEIAQKCRLPHFAEMNRFFSNMKIIALKLQKCISLFYH